MQRLVLLLASICCVTDAVVPTAELAFTRLEHKPQFANMLGASSHTAGWGVRLPQVQNSRWKHVHMLPTANASNAMGCDAYTLPSTTTPSTGHDHDHTHGHGEDLLKTLVVVDRGNCSFLQKAWLAELAGARGLVVRGTKRAVYESIHNAVNGSHAADRPLFEYDCGQGEAFVQKLDTPVWETDDPRCARDPQCGSQSCVLTGVHDPTRGGHQLCCMWDTAVLMGANRTLAANVTIPVVYVSVANGLQLQRSLERFPDLLIRTYEREAPLVDVSSILLWALGVATALGAAFYSAASDRERYRCRTDPEYQRCRQQQQQQEGRQEEHASTSERQEPWELSTQHAVAFIVSAALFLTVLYYVKSAHVIPVLFAVSATGTLTQLVTSPLLQALVPAVASRQLTAPCCPEEPWPLSELVGFVLTGAIAVVWYVFRRTCWYLQNLFGISVCFVFLQTVQVPNLKVATLLLSLAFVYDIFFVFLSPLVFGSSVMEDVATGGPAAYTRDDYPGVDYCERYPTFPACLDPEPMPMLLVLPRFWDWQGGVSMLGLGDIIIPGLVLSFALRFDYSPQSLGENYFRTVAIGYAIGLGLANLAVTVTQVGQPALMYLVPTCLGSLVLRSRANGDFRAMWRGVGLHDDGALDKRSDAMLEAGDGSKPVGQSRPDGSIVVNDGQLDQQAPLLGPVPTLR
ncbi:hypothetical protein ATCC90586_000839 [Pythium insidiosum]|nr:hypothetical protein ATCC90586_000839 [Pythium insidiosum]